MGQKVLEAGDVQQALEVLRRSPELQLTFERTAFRHVIIRAAKQGNLKAVLRWEAAHLRTSLASLSCSHVTFQLCQEISSLQAFTLIGTGLRTASAEVPATSQAPTCKLHCFQNDHHHGRSPLADHCWRAERAYRVGCTIGSVWPPL